jgi:hypothetical protein
MQRGIGEILQLEATRKATEVGICIDGRKEEAEKADAPIEVADVGMARYPMIDLWRPRKYTIGTTGAE